MSEDPWGFAALQTPDEIRAHFRRLAKEHHPDRGGDAVKFDEMRAAFMTALHDAEQEPSCPVCETCGGSGRVTKGSGFYSIKLTCPECGGSGEVG
jgi:DnaJ-class molecular chaperone